MECSRVYFNAGGHTGVSVDQPVRIIDLAVNQRGCKEDSKRMLRPSTWDTLFTPNLTWQVFFDHPTPQLEIDPVFRAHSKSGARFRSLLKSRCCR